MLKINRYIIMYYFYDKSIQKKVTDANTSLIMYLSKLIYKNSCEFWVYVKHPVQYFYSIDTSLLSFELKLNFVN